MTSTEPNIHEDNDILSNLIQEKSKYVDNNFKLNQSLFDFYTRLSLFNSSIKYTNLITKGISRYCKTIKDLEEKEDLDEKEYTNIDEIGEIEEIEENSPCDSLCISPYVDVKIDDDHPNLKILKTPPIMKSKDGKILNDLSKVTMFKFDMSLGDNFFGPNSKSLITKIDKPDVTIRPTIEFPDDVKSKFTSYSKDPMINSPTIDEIFLNFDKEEQYIIRENIIENNLNINSDMFEILVNWIVLVHIKFKLALETLYLTIHLIKEYIHRVKAVRRSKFQLLGIACILIASKYEEIKCVEIYDLTRICDHAYTEVEIKLFELEILTTLNFNINVPTSFTFMCRYIVVINSDTKIIKTACYILERSLQESQYFSYLPSELAASALYLARKINKLECWPLNLIYHTKYTKEHISKIADKLEMTCKTISSNNAVFSKYSSSSFDFVANLFE